MKKIEAVKEETDREDSNTIIDLLRDNIKQWESALNASNDDASPEKEGPAIKIN